MARMVAFVNCCGQLDHGDGLALIVGWKGRRSKVAGVVGVRVGVGVDHGLPLAVYLYCWRWCGCLRVLVPWVIVVVVVLMLVVMLSVRVDGGVCCCWGGRG